MSHMAASVQAFLWSVEVLVVLNRGRFGAGRVNRRAVVSAVQCSSVVGGADLCVAEHVRAGAIRDAAVMTQDLHSMLLDMPPDTTIKVERQLRERIRGAAQGKSMTINQFLETLMKDYERRDRMARAAEAMRSASPEVMAAYREEMKIWDRALMDGLDGW